MDFFVNKVAGLHNAALKNENLKSFAKTFINLRFWNSYFGTYLLEVNLIALILKISSYKYFGKQPA